MLLFSWSCSSIQADYKYREEMTLAKGNNNNNKATLVTLTPMITANPYARGVLKYRMEIYRKNHHFKNCSKTDEITSMVIKCKISPILS